MLSDVPTLPPPPGGTAGGDGDLPRARRRSWNRLRTGDWAIDLTLLGTVLMGFNRWRVADYPWSDFIFVAAAGIIILRLLTGRSRTLAPAEARRSSTMVLCGALVVLTAGTLSSFGAWDPLGSIGVVLRLSWLTLVLFWIIRSVTVDRSVFDSLLRAWKLGALIAAAMAVSGELGIANFSVENNENRQTAFFNHPNDLAGYLVVALPLFVLGLPRRNGQGRVTLRSAPAIALLAYAISATGSMSALIGGVVGLAATFFAMWTTRNPRRTRHRHPLFVMLALTGSALGLVWLSTTDIPLVTRISEWNQGDTGVNASVESRNVRNKTVTDRVDELLGVGIGLDRKSPGKIANVTEGTTIRDLGVHNMYLKVLLETGLPGLVGLWIIITATLLQAWRLMVNLRDDPLHPTAAALFGAMVTVNVFAMFQPILYHRYYWMPVAMIGTLWAMRRQELRRSEERRQQEAISAATAVAPMDLLPGLPAGS